MTAFELTKALLRGKFVDVSRFRKNFAAQYNRLPESLQETANRFLGQGTGDAEGRRALGEWLQENSP